MEQQRYKSTNQRACWDFINTLRTTNKKYNKHTKTKDTTRIVSTYGYTYVYWEYVEHCEWCNEDFFRPEKSNNPFCSTECKKNYKKWVKEEDTIRKYIRNKYNKKKYSHRPKMSEKNRKAQSEFMKKRMSNEKYRKYITDNLNKKKKKSISGKPLFDSYNELLMKETIRRDPVDDRLLQVRCIVCKEWFNPTVTWVSTRIRCIRNGLMDTRRPCCSKECTKIRQTKCATKWTTKSKTYNWQIIKFTWYDNYIKQQAYKKKELLKQRRVLLTTLRKIKTKKKKEEMNKSEKIQMFIKNNNMSINEYRSMQVRKKYHSMKKENPLIFKVNRLLYTAKASAKDKNIEFSLDKEWLLAKIEAGCEVTGLPFCITTERLKQHRHYLLPSIDRIDSSIGYTKTNCRVVIWAFNCGRRNFEDKDLYYALKNFVNTYEA